jgi:PAS domain S-box-containing protein
VEARLSLEAAEARYRAVFDQVAMGVARVSPKGRFLELNDRFCAICGYPRTELLGLTFQDITHPEDLDIDVAQARALLAGDTATYSLEKRYLTKAGEEVWVNLTVSLVRTAAGEPDYFVSIIEDIGARKSAQEEQQRYQRQLRLLINELNHRVKNMLATVQSVARQSLGRARGSGPLADFEDRLMALAWTHDILTREHWAGASLNVILTRTLAPHAGAGRVELDGPDLRISPKMALALAMGGHELATNAVKYGALSNESGRIAVRWRLDPETTPVRLILDWQEAGGPPVEPPKSRGFGSRLLERGLAGELGGEVKIAFEPAGVRCRISAPFQPENPEPDGELEGAAFMPSAAPSELPH